MSILLGLLTQFWPYIVGAIGLGIAAMKLRQSGARAERAKQAAAEAKARDIADAVDNDLSLLTPEQKRKELSQWSKS